MPVVFSRSQIEAIAALAHLRLDDEEIELYSRQLGDIQKSIIKSHVKDMPGSRVL